jgi:hypothetical protein
MINWSSRIELKWSQYWILNQDCHMVKLVYIMYLLVATDGDFGMRHSPCCVGSRPQWTRKEEFFATETGSLQLLH